MALKDNFEAANTTHDNRLTREQAEAAGMKQVVANFDSIDTERQGFVTYEQVKHFKAEKNTSQAAKSVKKASVAGVRDTMARVAERKARGGDAASVAGRFAHANTTGDGKLTKQQAGAAGNKALREHFDRLDVEGKGYLTLDQVEAFFEQRASA